jgi:hypothetical protein
VSSIQVVDLKGVPGPTEGGVRLWDAENSYPVEAGLR